MSFVDVKVPAVGESITEVVVSQWLVEEGAAVKVRETRGLTLLVQPSSDEEVESIG